MVRSMQVSLGLPDPRDMFSLPMLKRVQALIAERTQPWSGSILGAPNVINSELEPTSFLDAQVILSAQSQPRGSGSGHFFQLPRAQAVTKAWFVDQLHVTLSAMGLSQHLYAGHSFRIGAATTAPMAGVEDAMIQTLGHWQSAAYVQYV